MVDAGEIRTYVHLHVSRRLYHCAKDADKPLPVAHSIRFLSYDSDVMRVDAIEL